jgi:hypothetical protein
MAVIITMSIIITVIILISPGIGGIIYSTLQTTIFGYLPSLNSLELSGGVVGLPSLS